MSEPFESKPLPKPVDTQAAMLEALAALDALNVEHALIGGLAISYYGVERYTKDVDFVVGVETTLRATAQFHDKDPRPLRIGGVSIMTTSGVRVDFIDRREEYKALFEEALKAAIEYGPRATIGEYAVPVVPLPYLIALKQVAGRAQDEADLAFLLRQEHLDYKRTRDIIYRHAGDFAARWLDKQARLAGRRDTPKDYSLEES
jgi:hypothetical protein